MNDLINQLITRLGGPEPALIEWGSCSQDSEYLGRFNMEYKKSHGGPNDYALMLCDDETWSLSTHFNYELDQPPFINLEKLKAAIDSQTNQGKNV